MQFFIKFEQCQTQMRNVGIQSATGSPLRICRTSTRNTNSKEDGEDSEFAQVQAEAQEQAQAVNSLRLENKTLKLALAQSAANATRWEFEMKSLEEQNQRLFQALMKFQRSSTENDKEGVNNVTKKF